MATSESKGRFFLQNKLIRITNRIDSNRELECSSKDSRYSTAERRVVELIPVLGSQPAGDVSH